MTQSTVDLNPGAGGEQIGTDKYDGSHYQLVQAGPVIRPVLHQFLTLAGDGTGTHEFTQDYTTPDDVFIAPAAGEIMVVESLKLLIADSGAFTSSGFGQGAALTNGLEIKHMTDHTTPVLVKDFTASQHIKTNTHLFSMGFDVDESFTGALAMGGPQLFGATLQFGGEHGGLILDNANADFLGVFMADDLTGIDVLTALAQGFYLKV